MEKLILKKQSKGYYYNQIDNIRIEVSEFNNLWEGIITDESKKGKDYILFKSFGTTKKEIVYQIITYLLNN